jgi:predicted RND superfamily exporter protein
MRKIAIAILGVHLLLIGAALFLQYWPESVGDTRELYPGESESLTNLQTSERVFGSGLFDAIIVPATETLSFDLEELESELSQMEGVVSVVSPLQADESGISRGFQTRSRDGNHVRFLLKIDPDLDSHQRTSLHEKLNELRKQFLQYSPIRSGSFFVSESLSKSIQTETARLVPLAGIVVFLVALVLFRSLRLALGVLLSPILALASVTLSAGLTQSPLGPVSQLAPPFIIVVGSAYAIHITLQIVRCGELPRGVVWAILLAAGTTAIGLTSLVIIGTKGVTQFALLASIGNMLAALYSLVFVPLIVQSRQQRILPIRIPPPSVALQRKLFGVLIVSSLVLSTGLYKLYLDTNPVSFLPKNGSALAQVEEVQRVFPGNRFISLLIHKESSSPYSDEDVKNLTWIEELLAEQAEVLSILDPVSALEKRSRLEEMKVEEFSLRSESEFYRRMNFLVSEDRKLVRFVFEVDVDGQALLGVVARLQHELEKRDKSQDFGFAAFEIVMAEQAYSITIGIVQSLCCTLAIVFVVLLLISRSLIVSSIGLIPNIIPLLTVFGLIGWVFGEVSLGAALVASAVLGIAVDNTFHFILLWKEKREQAHITSALSVEQSLSQLIAPFIFTTLILSLGFIVMIFAKVLPTLQFGLLLSISLWIGLLADITVLPILLSRVDKTA